MTRSIFHIQCILWPIPVPLVLNLACVMEQMLSNARFVHSASCRMGRLAALYPVSLAQLQLPHRAVLQFKCCIMLAYGVGCAKIPQDRSADTCPI